LAVTLRGSRMTTICLLREPANQVAPSCQVVQAPKGTPAEIVDKLNRQINAALTDSNVKSRLSEWGASALPGSPADFGKLITENSTREVTLRKV
jgi:tripartite-type tricarboxylate transporter receptor subunit TctC